jgi:hypothetical protein
VPRLFRALCASTESPKGPCAEPDRAREGLQAPSKERKALL